MLRRMLRRRSLRALASEVPQRDDAALASTLSTLATQISSMQQAMLRHETSAPVVRQTRRASMANVVQDLQSLKTDATDEKVAAAKEDLASYAESLRRGLANAEAPADRDELRSELTALQRAVVELKEVDKDAARPGRFTELGASSTLSGAPSPPPSPTAP